MKATLPPRVLVYGPPGIGKTTLAAEFPSPVFLQVEDGTPSDLTINSFGRLTSYDEVMEAIAALYTEEHANKTMVLDSVDKLEPLVWAKLCADNNLANIEAAGFGKGYVLADAYWRDLLEGANALRRDKNMNVVFIAHSSIENVNDPTSASYSQYTIRLHKRAVALMQDEMDCIFFVNQDVTLKANDASGKSKSGPGARVRADGGGNRFIHTSPRPSYIAKNRYGLPDRIQYEKGKVWEVLSPYFPGNAKKPAAAVKAA